MMLMPEIIGLYSPLPRSGKGTAAQVLCKEFGYGEMRFSDPIRMMWAAFHEMDFNNTAYWIAGGALLRTLEGDLKETPFGTSEISYRDFAVTVGEEFRKAFGPDFWVNHFAARYMHVENSGTAHVVISDMRYPNEYYWVKQQGGQCWRIRRTDGGGGPKTISEGLLDRYTFDVDIAAPDPQSIERAVKTVLQ